MRQTQTTTEINATRRQRLALEGLVKLSRQNTLRWDVRQYQGKLGDARV